MPSDPTATPARPHRSALFGVVAALALVAAGLIGVWLFSPGYRLPVMLTFGPLAIVFGVVCLSIARGARMEAARQAAAADDPRLSTVVGRRPPMPLPLRRHRAYAHACIGAGFVLSMAALAAIWGFLGFRVAGTVGFAAMLPFFLVGIGGSAILERRRRALLAKLAEHEWRLCTACAYPLAVDVIRCPECGLAIGASDAAAAWLAHAQWR